MHHALLLGSIAIRRATQTLGNLAAALIAGPRDQVALTALLDDA